MSSSRVINQTQLNLNKKQKIHRFYQKQKNFSNETNVINVFESFKNLKVLIIGRINYRPIHFL